MLAYVLDAWDGALAELDGTGTPKPIVVYSPATEAVRDVVGDRGELALQDVPRGTGDAVRAAHRRAPGRTPARCSCCPATCRSSSASSSSR